MAAGLGSRFGAGEGQKQVTPVDENGHLIIDYSVYDAYVSGFEKVVFVIKPESKEKFHALIGANVSKHMEVAYAFQTLESCLPEGFKVPEGRVKPWGTGHAALCSESEVEDGFVCINADDFYGRSAFAAAARFLDEAHPQNRHAMVGYELRNTMTPKSSAAIWLSMVSLPWPMSAEPTSSCTVASSFRMRMAELKPSLEEGPEPWQLKEMPQAVRTFSSSTKGSRSSICRCTIPTAR